MVFDVVSCEEHIMPHLLFPRQLRVNVDASIETLQINIQSCIGSVTNTDACFPALVELTQINWSVFGSSPFYEKQAFARIKMSNQENVSRTPLKFQLLCS